MPNRRIDHAPRVALDGTPLLGARTGIGHVTAELLAALATRGDLDLTAFAITWRGRDALAAALPVGVRAAARPIPARLVRKLWGRFSFPPIEWWTGSVDVVHATNFVAPPTRAAVILTVHDLTFATRPDLCTDDTLGYANLVRRAIDRGATIHVDSDAVRGQVIAHFDIAPTRVVRIYPGIASSPPGDAAAGRSSAGTDHYVLALGTIEPRKNLPALVRAFSAVHAAHPEYRLVVAGPDGWDAGAFATAVASLGDPGVVRQLGYVTDAQRADLLAGATALAYPSLDEGFGRPPLEAMQVGVPVVASDAGSIPEVLGDAALLVAPTDEVALAGALERVLTDKDCRAQLVDRGRERVARYSWQQAAAEFDALYRRLATPK